MSGRFQQLTRGKNPLFVFDNKHILAVGNPDGTKLKNTFTPEQVPLTNEDEKKLFEQEGLDNINPNDFFKGGIAHKKRSKKRHTSHKTNKRRSSKKRKSRRNNKKKSK
jgi:hypothetical protein